MDGRYNHMDNLQVGRFQNGNERLAEDSIMKHTPLPEWGMQLLGSTCFRELACGLSVVERDERYTIRSPFSRLLMGLTGEWTIYLPGTAVQLGPGRAVVVPTDLEATYDQKEGVRFLWLYFRMDYGGCIDIFHLLPPDQMSLPVSGAAVSRFRRLIRSFLQEDLCERLRSMSILIELLLPFLKESMESEDHVVAIDRLLPVLRYIDDHLGERMENEELARLLYLSPKYFCNLFSELTGVPPAAYVNRRRVLRAKERLLIGSEQIKTIAREVGFADPLYFTRVFRKLEGMSPYEYRHRYAAAQQNR